MSINFLHKDEKAKKTADEVKAKVIPLTTAVLVVYLVLIAALSGWWFWWNSKQKLTSAEYALLKSQVDSLQQSEVLVRRMNHRIDAVSNFLKKNNEVVKYSEFLVDQPFDVVEFGLNDEGYYYVSAAASDSAELLALSNTLKEKFTNVSLKELVWEDTKQSWKAEIWYKGVNL